MQTIKAAICHAFGQPLTVEDIQIRAPQGSEVEVTIDAVAVCQSDISYAEGAWGGTLPAVYGHEAAGRVTATGPSAKGISVGDPVVVTLIRSCQSCPTCASGHPVNCTTRYDSTKGPIHTLGGGTLDQGLATGAFAEKVVVEAAQLVKLPDGIAPDVACLLGCGVITGVGAVVNTAGLRPGQVAVVIGAGGVGLNAVQGAHLAGAAHVIAVDMTQDKLDGAMAFGATAGILATAETPWKAARKASGGRGADAVFVTVGQVAAYDTAPRYLAPRGKVIVVGMPHSGETARYEPVVMAALGQGVQASLMGDTVISRVIPWMVELYQQGRLKLDELVSARWRLDQINEAIADTKSGAARRNVIVMR